MGTLVRDTSRRERPAAAAYASHLLFGIVMALLGAILPTLSTRIGFDLAQAGRLFLVMNSCLLLSSLGLGPLMDRFGMKPPLVVGSLLAGAGLAVVALARDYETLAWGTAVLGLGGGALNTGGNTLVADLHQAQEARSAALNRLGVFFGIGALLIPLAIGLLLQAAELGSILLAGAVLCAAVALHNVLVPLPPPKRQRHVPLARRRAPRARAVRARLRGAALLPVRQRVRVRRLRVLVPGARDRPLRAGGVVGAHGVLGRADAGAARAEPRGSTRERLRLLVVCALASAAGTTLLASSRHPAVAVLAVAWMGAFLAGIFPTALGIVGARYPAFTGTVFGLLITAALTGGMLLPWLTGLIGEAHGLRPAMALVAAQCLAIAALAAHAGRRHSGFGSGGGPSGT